MVDLSPDSQIIHFSLGKLSLQVDRNKLIQINQDDLSPIQPCLLLMRFFHPFWMTSVPIVAKGEVSILRQSIPSLLINETPRDLKRFLQLLFLQQNGTVVNILQQARILLIYVMIQVMNKHVIVGMTVLSVQSTEFFVCNNINTFPLLQYYCRLIPIPFVSLHTISPPTGCNRVLQRQYSIHRVILHNTNFPSLTSQRDPISISRDGQNTWEM